MHKATVKYWLVLSLSDVGFFLYVLRNDRGARFGPDFTFLRTSSSLRSTRLRLLSLLNKLESPPKRKSFAVRHEPQSLQEAAYGH